MSAHILNLSIVTPATTAFSGTVLAVSVPGSQSPFQILYNHAPIISALDTGVMKVEDEHNHVTFFASKEGFVEVLKNTVSIVVYELVEAKNVNVDVAESDLAEARSIADTHPDRHERDNARKSMHWAEARLRAAKLQSELA
ncbi:ATP synthase F1 subunit epsilon [soil metagenome]